MRSIWPTRGTFLVHAVASLANSNVEIHGSPKRPKVANKEHSTDHTRSNDGVTPRAAAISNYAFPHSSLRFQELKTGHPYPPSTYHGPTNLSTPVRTQCTPRAHHVQDSWSWAQVMSGLGPAKRILSEEHAHPTFRGQIEYHDRRLKF